MLEDMLAEIDRPNEGHDTNYRNHEDLTAKARSQTSDLSTYA
jgi:hypothetical protein